MIRRPPRSTPLSLHDALPIWAPGGLAVAHHDAVVFGCYSQLGEGAAAGQFGPEPAQRPPDAAARSEEHTSELQSQSNLVCRLLLEKKKKRDEDKDGKYDSMRR